MGASRIIRSRPLSKIKAVLKIPNNLLLIGVVTHIDLGIMTYHGLVNFTRLQKGEKVLIYLAISATGQMPIGITTIVGAE